MNEIHSSSVSASLAVSPLVLALDVGTSSVRAMLFDRLRRALEGVAARRPHAVTVRRDGTNETDADRLLEQLFECVDANGQPCTPLMTYADTRPTADAAGTARCIFLKLDF
jgi:gluconokinase